MHYPRGIEHQLECFAMLQCLVICIVLSLAVVHCTRHCALSAGKGSKDAPFLVFHFLGSGIGRHAIYGLKMGKICQCLSKAKNYKTSWGGGLSRALLVEDYQKGYFLTLFFTMHNNLKCASSASHQARAIAVQHIGLRLELHLCNIHCLTMRCAISYRDIIVNAAS